MKQLYTITCLSFCLFTAKAQTFSPALKSSSGNIFTYDFGQVKANSSKQIDFTITGVANGSTFKTRIDQELDFVDNGYCDVAYGDSNFVITVGHTGSITQNKGTITVTFNPKDFEYNEAIFVNDWGGLSFNHCETATKTNYGIKTATMTVTLYTPNAKDYIINLTGNSVSTVTALENENEIQNATLFYPNPVKDILNLNQEAIVYDAFGKTILSGKGTMNVSGIPSGVYFVHSDGQVQKFVKE